MTTDVIPDGDGHDSTTVMSSFRLPKIPANLTVDEAARMWAEISASDALPEHVKDELGQQLNARLDVLAGRAKPSAAASTHGVWFSAARPDEVEAGLKQLAKSRRSK